MWHDTLTNTRGSFLEELITSNQLYTMKEESTKTTSRNHLGTSNIDLKIICPQLIISVFGWAISDQESISEHSIIKYAITKKESIVKFQGNFLR